MQPGERPSVSSLRMQRFRFPLIVLSASVLLGGCDPSDLRAYIEGTREIPAEYDAMVPEEAREDLIDVDVEHDGGLSLRYHEGDWSKLLGAFGSKLESGGYVKLGACPTSDGEADGSVTYAKLTDGGNADVVMVGLGVLIKSSGHFFLDVKHKELSTMFLPDGCAFADSAAEICDDTTTGMCSFKEKS